MGKAWAVAILAVVVVVDLLLVAAARDHVQGEPVSSAADLPAVTPTGTDAPVDAATTVLLSLAADGTVAHAERGRCAAGVQRTLTITAVDGADSTDAEPGVTEVLRVQATDADTLYVVGTTDDCDEVVERLTDDGGQTWRDTTGGIDWWHYAPGSVTTVVTPAGSSETDCTVTGLSQTGETGVAGCSDGRVRSSADGTTWADNGRLDGLRALGFFSAEAGGALAADAACATRFHATGDAGATWTPAGCVPGDGPAALAVDGPVAVAIVGGTLAVSTDGGTTWA